MLSFVDSDASIVLHPGARLVVRNAAFYTPFRGWHGYQNLPWSERPPDITGITFVSQGGSVALDNFVCEGLKYCLSLSSPTALSIKKSLFSYTLRAIYGYDGSLRDKQIVSSMFFRNDQGIHLRGYGWSVEDCFFLQNRVGAKSDYSVNYMHSSFIQNGEAASCSWSCHFSDVLFYQNDVAYVPAGGIWQNVTFLENRLSLKLTSKLNNLQGINFIGSESEYHIYYTGSALYDFNLSSTYWNMTTEEEVEAKTYHAVDGSGQGLVRLLDVGSLARAPFYHSMYQADPCAGQCAQDWFNTNWSSLIGAGEGTFGLYGANGSLSSGQKLQDALLKGHQAPSNMSLSMYVQDLVDLLEAVAAYEMVGTTTSPLPSTTSSTTTSTTTTITTLAAHIIAGADVVLTEPIWLIQNTTWTSADGVRALAKKVEVLPDATFTIEGTQTSFAVWL